MRDTLKNILERLDKVVILAPVENPDAIQQLKDDARWLAAQLQAALDELDRLAPKEVA